MKQKRLNHNETTARRKAAFILPVVSSFRRGSISSLSSFLGVFLGVLGGSFSSLFLHHLFATEKQKRFFCCKTLLVFQSANLISCLPVCTSNFHATVNHATFATLPPPSVSKQPLFYISPMSFTLQNSCEMILHRNSQSVAKVLPSLIFHKASLPVGKG